MLTVGEMVMLQAKREPFLVNELAGAAFVPVRALESLGIWGAEVLEGKLGVVAPDGAVYAQDIVLWVGDDTTFSLGAPGQRVRVIVLKEE